MRTSDTGEQALQLKDAPAAVSAAAPQGSQPNERHVARDAQTFGVFESIKSAAAKLGCKPDALRARCRRAACHERNALVTHLGGGITAFKFGKNWRIKFPVA